MASNVNSNLSQKNGSLECVVRLDRVIFGANPTVEFRTPETAETKQLPPPPDIPGYKVVKDTWVRPQGRLPTYRRVRSLTSEEDGSRVSIQYKREMLWLKHFRLTLFADDKRGLTPKQIDKIMTQFSSCKFSLVELAFDFDSNSAVDGDFVLRYGVFGKSWRRINRGGPDQIRYGSRRSLKLVRAYWKKTLGCFRVELEIHAPLLRKYGVRSSRDFTRLAENLFPAHILFMQIRWRVLEKYLAKRFPRRGRTILEEAQRRAERSLRRATEYLARQGVSNPRRFLRPLRINTEVETALKRWADRFG